MSASLELHGVSKSYGKVPVLQSLDLSVQEGEFVCLLGPSGCGKTTLLRIIAGLLFPTTGQIDIVGREVTALTPSERNIAMVFQSYALYPHKTVWENIAFPLRMRAPWTTRIPFFGRLLSERRELESVLKREVPAVAQALGLEKLLTRKPYELSGGQKQRVALARALVRNPDLFLMDEPLSNLDAKLRTETRREIVNLHARTGKTFIYVTHDQVEAMTMAHRIVLLYEGKVQQIGAPLALYDDPENLFTVTFIGTPTINQLQFKVRPGQVPLLEGVPWESPSAQKVADALAPGVYTLGIRPESLVPQSDRSPDAFAVTTDYCEEMGSETIVWCRTGLGKRTLCLRLSRMNDRYVGSITAVAPDWTKLLIFDAEGRRVRLSSEANAAGVFNVELRRAA